MNIYETLTIFFRMTRMVSFDIPEPVDTDNWNPSRMTWIFYSGLRDPNMSKSERKMLRLIAYLGLEVYKDWKEERNQAIEARNAVLNSGEFSRAYQFEPFEIGNRVVDINRLLSNMELRLSKLHKFLFSLAGNFEELHPMGTRFIEQLEELNFQSIQELVPIAVINLDDSFLG